MKMLFLVLSLIAGSHALSINGTDVEKRASSRELLKVTSFQSGSHMLDQFHTLSHGKFGEDAMDVVADPSHHSSHNCLRVHYAKGSYSVTKDIDRGAQFYAPVSTHTAMSLSYDLFFSPHFDFVDGGKLPGLWGGEEALCSGGRKSEDCFTTRFMWREHGHGEVYAYIPTDHQKSGFCDLADVECDPRFGNSLGRGKWTFPVGKWFNIAQYVHLNTVGHADGYLKVWLDNKLVFEMHNLVFRTKDSIRIKGMFFSTFFGGSSSDRWASTQSCYSYFRNFVLHQDPSPQIIG